MKKVIASILGGLLLVAAIPFFIFWYGEKKRDQLIARYQAPPSFLEDIFTKEKGPVRSLMKSHETIVCAIGSYGSVDDLSQLNAKQKSSLPKEDLPSEDLTWYLLFFTKDSVSRVYLINSAELGGTIEGTGGGCVDHEGQFMVQEIKEINSGNKYVLNISQRVQ